MNDYLPYLQHHGILGMKWGVRRYQNPDGGLTSAGQKRYSRQKQREEKRLQKKASENRKDPKTMSDQELRTALNRMNMERQYKQLQGDSRARKGLKVAAKALEIVGSLSAVAASALTIANIATSAKKDDPKIKAIAAAAQVAKGIPNQLAAAARKV